METDWKSPGDGLLTVTPVEGLAWLDLTESVGRSWSEVAAECQGGGYYDGFRHATAEEVARLWMYAGVGGLNPIGPDNYHPVLRLIGRIGATDVSDPLSPVAEAFTRGAGSSGTHGVTYLMANAAFDPPIGVADPTYLILGEDVVSPSRAHWLVRESGRVPVLSSLSPDGRLTWYNVAGNGTASVEMSSPATGHAWATIHAEEPTQLVSQIHVSMAGNEARFRVHHFPEDIRVDYMELVPSGTFQMGDATRDYPASAEHPVHPVYVSAFYLDRFEVTNDEMLMALQWALESNPPRLTITNATVRNARGDPQILLDLGSSYSRITWDGSAFGVKDEKGFGFPCANVSWFGAVTYCNFRSHLEGLTPCYDLDDWSCSWNADGYRLPTEAEWEKAARGGLMGSRFPWGDTISHGQANYYASSSYTYDLSSGGYHPDYKAGIFVPSTSPVGSFAANGYGLYDMTGNVLEWCWDWSQQNWYEQAEARQNDTRGPDGPRSLRVLRGGSFANPAPYQRCASRAISVSPDVTFSHFGFRCARSAVLSDP